MDLLLQVILNGIIAAAGYALLAMGFNLLYGASRFINASHGVVAVSGGYATYAILAYTPWSPWLAIVFGVLISVTMSVLFEVLVFGPMRRRGSTTLTRFVASLGGFMMVPAILSIIFTPEYQSLPRPLIERSIEIGSGIITGIQFFTIVVAIVACILLVAFLSKTKTGKMIRAISDDEEVARMIGIRTDRVALVIAMIAGILAGLAGSLLAFDVGLQPTMGMTLILKCIIVAVIGGLGTIPGALVGALILGIVENVGIIPFSSEWKDAIAFVILLVFLVIRPYGIFGKK